MKDWMRPSEAAVILEVSRQTITQWCRDGIIAAERVGTRWRIKRTVIEAFKKSNQPDDNPKKVNGLALTY